MGISTILHSEIHPQIRAKIARGLQTDIRNAKKLQDFFQDLKALIRAYDAQEQVQTIGKLMGRQALELLLDDIAILGQSRYGNFNIKNMFLKRGGIRFENELARVIEAIMNRVAIEPNFQFDSSQVLLGTKSGSTLSGLSKSLSESVIKQVSKEMLQSAQDIIENPFINQGARSGKIDVKGYEIEVSADPNLKEFVDIYRLLKDATFTAKNYDSMSWSSVEMAFVNSSGGSSIHLGGTNFFKAIYGALSYLGYGKKLAVEYTFRAHNKVVREGETGLHTYHLRYMYELMGTGFKYSDPTLNPGIAKYLIYNDPHGGIYVKSTKEIINSLLDAHIVQGDVKKGLSISREYFY